MNEYPEHDKLHAVVGKSQAIGEFLEWLQSPKEDGGKGIRLCEVRCPHGYPPSQADSDYFDCEESDYCRSGAERDTLWLAHLDIQEVLADYFEIDRKRLEAEKDAMLQAIRAKS